MAAEKKFRCCCGLKFVKHNGAISHAEDRHRDSDFHLCDKPKCLAVVTVKVKGVKHRHDFGQLVAESSGDVAEGSCSDEIAESSASAGVAGSRPCERGKWGKK